MSENFAELFQESLKTLDMRVGSIVKARVVEIDNEMVTVTAGLKSESLISVEQFKNDQGQLEVNLGDEIDVAIDALEDGYGETVLSREKAKRAEAWIDLARKYESNATVLGVISGKVKGGFTVEINSIRAFLPGSLVDVRPVRDPSYLEGKELEFKVIKIDKKRNNVVVSRRSVVEEENSAERSAMLEKLQEGQEVVGIVKNLTDYGAFVDLGGIDGLLHITDMSWKRIKHPSELVNVGDEIQVKVLKFDRDKNRVSLGMKQLGDDPWVDLVRRYPVGTRLSGKVTNLTDYGCFVEIEDGVEGLVHVSEMDWTNKNIHPSKVVQLGVEVDVLVLDIDQERRRISLGIKQCTSNPWEAFSENHEKGEKIVGKIKSITDFGIFIGLDGGIDGLIHLSDISWNEPGEVAVRHFKKGDEIETITLAIDAERERISLGIKQLEADPFTQYIELNPKGSIVKGVVTEIDQKQATVKLVDEVFASLRAGEIKREKVSDVANELKVNEEVEAKIINIDKKARSISLSIKAKDSQDEANALKEYSRSSDNKPSTTLGDILKEQMDNDARED